MHRNLPGLRVMFLVMAAASAWICATMPVFSQEAYYWTYAQHPDLSYFDHPPIVAWLIWIGTHLFGDGSVGIRLGSWLCGLGTTWLGVLMLRDFGIGRIGQSLWVLLSIAVPIMAMVHFLTNPDPPLVLFWSLTMLALWRARGGGLGWWMLAGLAAGLALLSKYTAAFLAISGVVILLLDPAMRRQLLRPGPYVGVLIAAVLFSPVVIWNLKNDFESFRFQTEERLKKGEFGAHWFLQAIGGQLAVIHPVVLALLPLALVWLVRRLRHDPRALWMLAFGVPLPVYMLFQSLWIQIKINWLAPAYVPLLLGLVIWWRAHATTLGRPRLARAMVWSLFAVPLAMPLAPLIRLLPPGSGSSWTGWDEIALCAEKWEERIDQEDGIDSNVFFFAADYRDAAQLGRNLRLAWNRDGHHASAEGHPDPGEPTLAQNVFGHRALQFDHWNRPTDHIGQHAVFVLPRPSKRSTVLAKAAKRFDSIELVEHVQIECLGIDLLAADIYVCRNYRGPKADD